MTSRPVLFCSAIHFFIVVSVDISFVSHCGTTLFLSLVIVFVHCGTSTKSR